MTRQDNHIKVSGCEGCVLIVCSSETWLFTPLSCLRCVSRVCNRSTRLDTPCSRVSRVWCWGSWPEKPSLKLRSASLTSWSSSPCQTHRIQTLFTAQFPWLVRYPNTKLKFLSYFRNRRLDYGFGPIHWNEQQVKIAICLMLFTRARLSSCALCCPSSSFGCCCCCIRSFLPRC